MSENSYLSMFADPSSDMFSPLAPNVDDGLFMSSLQPSLVTSLSSSYQPMESESIMTLGEPAVPKSLSGPSGMSYTQLGMGGPQVPYGMGSSALHQQYQGQHSTTHRFPPSNYYPSPGSAAYPSQQPNPQRFGHDPYRQAGYPTSYPVMGHLGPPSNVPQQTSSGTLHSWQSPPPSQSFMGSHQNPMRQYSPLQASYSVPPESQQQQFMQQQQQQFVPQVRGMLPGYAQHLSTQMHQQYPPNAQYGYSAQTPSTGVPSRLPGLPYGMPAQTTNRYGPPQPPTSIQQQQQPSQQQPQQQQQQQHRAPGTGMFASAPRPQAPQETAPQQRGSQVSEKPAPSNTPTSMPNEHSQSRMSTMNNAGGHGAVRSPSTPNQESSQQVHRSPENCTLPRPTGPPLASSSPLPSMFQQHQPQPRMTIQQQPQQQPSQPPLYQPGPQGSSPSTLMGPPGKMLPRPQLPPMQQSGVASPGGLYSMNGSGPPPQYQTLSPMMQQPQRAPAPPQNAMSAEEDLRMMKMHLQSYYRSGQRTPEVDKKIIEATAKIAAMERNLGIVPSSTTRMGFPPQQQQQSPGVASLSRPTGGVQQPPPGMMPGQSQPQQQPGQMMGMPAYHPLPSPHQMRSMQPPIIDTSNIPRPVLQPHSAPPVQNGYPHGPTNGHAAESTVSADAAAPAVSPKVSTDAFETAGSQDTDDESNKYATPKKKRKGGSSRKRPSSESPSKSRSRGAPKNRAPPKTTFQFGKKKKKRRGSDDEGDDLDATPPPSPSVIEQDFDGNYVEKRRSSRVTKRKKYVDDGDMESSDLDDRLPAVQQMLPLSSQGESEASTSENVPAYEPTMAEPSEPPRTFFVQPGDADPVVVEKIMAHRTGKRPVPKEPAAKPDAEKRTSAEPGEGEEKEVVVKPDETETEEVDVEEFYVKFKSYSYLHCDWKTLEELEQLDKRVKQKITRYKQKKENSDFMAEVDDEPFDPNYTEVDRVLDEREFPDAMDMTKTRKYFLCKWVGLPYDETTWEVEEDCDAKKIAEFRQRQIPPPPSLRKRISRPTARDWAKMEKAGIYKDGNTLRDYQLEGVNWLLFCWYQGQNCILADEMGLGKTVQSTVFLEHIRRFGIRGPFLVVVPLSTLGNWSREVETWTDMNAICYHGGSITREVIQEYEYYYKNDRGQRLAGIYKFNIFITTYEILLSDIMELKEIEWRAIVIDEAHRLKNKNCKLLEGLKLLNMEHRVLLTGTPLQNNVEELFSLLHFLEPERFSNAEAFSEDFGDLKTDDQVTKLQQLLKPMMLRRLKEDVEKSIAPKEETIIEVELTNMQKKWYRAILERNFTFLQKGTSSANVPNLMNTMMELRKCCNHPYLINGAEESIIEEFASQNNLDAQDPDLLMRALVHSAGKLVLIDKLLPKLKDGGHKVLIFSQMVRCLDILEDYLVQKRYLFERIDGRVRGPERQAAIDRFSREDSDRFVFLLCTRAGGLGINLTAADTVIIFDSDWNPQNDLQAQARCHRIGQDKSVKVYRLITRNSYEREMFDKASLKLGLDKAVLQSGQMSGGSSAGREAYNAAQQPLSKSDIEDLLRRGAYGALMEDDAAADQFCTEDIDQILQRRTQTVQLEAGEKGSTFSKASFAATGTRDDIDINDPDFWQKWAKKADVNTDKDVFENELIIHEPRRRLQVRRYGEEQEEEMLEEASDDDYDSDDESGKGRRGRKGKKGRGRDREMDDVRPGSWHRMECLKLERGLLTWGWGRWKEILGDSRFKRNFTEKDVEIFARTLVHHCCKQYSGSDDKAKPYIWELVLACYTEDWKARKAEKEQEVASEDQQASSSKSRKSRKPPKKGPTPEPEPENGELPNWETDPRYDPEKLLDVSFLKHMKKHSINRLVLRLKLLQNMKDEAILDLGDLIMADTPYEEILMEIPPAESLDKPTEWWNDDADKCLLVGVYKHGYENYAAVRNDPKLCFLAKCGPSVTVAVPPEPEEPKETTSDADPEVEETPETESTDAEAEGEGNKRRTREAKAQKEGSVEKPAPVKPGRGRKPAAAKKVTNTNGPPGFPSDPDLNTRVRRLIVAFEKRRIRAELMEVKRQQRQERQVALEKEREVRRLEQQQKKWSKREEGDFFRVVSTFGVEYGEGKDTFEWDKFRELSKLDKKLDKTLTEYFKSFYAMIRKVCGKKLSRDEEAVAEQVDAIPDDKASRCLQRIELLHRIRVTALRHPKLEERLKLSQPSSDLPNWWMIGQHDKELLVGAAKHGLLDTACNIAVDSDFTFADSIKSAMNGEPKKATTCSSKMESLLKREAKTEKVPQEPSKSEEPADEETTKPEAAKTATEESKEEKVKTENDAESAAVEDDRKEDEKVTEDVPEESKLKIEESPAEEDKPVVTEEPVDEKMKIDEEEPTTESVAKSESTEKVEPKKEKTDDVEPVGKVAKDRSGRSATREDSPTKTANREKASTPADSEETHGEMTVAQLLAKGMYAKGWPTDRVIQARLDHLCYCIEHNRWPSKRTQSVMIGSIPEEPGNQPTSSSSSVPQFPDFMDNPEFAMLAAAGQIPGLNGVETRRGRRGRRPKVEIEAERLAQYQAAHQALLQQQQALISAATATKNRRTMNEQEPRGSGSSSTRGITSGSSASRPPPAHQRASSNQAGSEIEGVLDLTGKTKPSASTSSSSSSARKEQPPLEKGSKLSQKVDTLLKKRKQETEADLMDPDCRIPVINLRDGSILQGDKAPKRKDLAQWLMDHKHYVVDSTAFAYPGMPGLAFGDAMTNGTSSKRSGHEASISEMDQVHLSGDENVTVINRKNGKKISGRKAPQLKNLADWLESNKDYDIDPSWTEILREQGANAVNNAKSGDSSSKYNRKGDSSSAAANVNLFGSSPFGAGFAMGPGGLLSGFGPRMPFGFPGLPGFPLPNALMSMLPGMGGDSEPLNSSSSSKTGESSSGKKTGEGGSSSSGKESSSRKSKQAEKEKQQQQQQAMDQMMQSQLPFIFPQAGLFGGLNPLFGQGFPGFAGGFPFAMGGPNPLLNGFKDLDGGGGSSEKQASKGEKEREKMSSSSSNRRLVSSPAASSSESSSRATAEKNDRELSSARRQRQKERERDVEKDKEKEKRARRAAAEKAAAESDGDAASE